MEYVSAARAGVDRGAWGLCPKAFKTLMEKLLACSSHNAYAVAAGSIGKQTLKMSGTYNRIKERATTVQNAAGTL
jgi:hypothetical protein